MKSPIFKAMWYVNTIEMNLHFLYGLVREIRYVVGCGSADECSGNSHFGTNDFMFAYSVN